MKAAAVIGQVAGRKNSRAGRLATRAGVITPQVPLLGISMLRALLLIILAVSLAANVWLAREVRRTPAARDPIASPTKRAVRESLAKVPAAGSWTLPDVDLSTDAGLRSLHQNLGMMGLPPEFIRGAMAIAIHRSYVKRREELLGQPQPHEYWRNRSKPPDASVLAAVRELEREQRKLARELVGEDFDFDDNSSQRRYGNLPPDKVAGLQKIFADYRDMEEQMYSESADRGAPETRARAELLSREKRKDIERLLTPDELLEYDLRNHPAAHRLRGRIGAYEVTEAEFRALYPAFKAVMDESPPKVPTSRANAAEARRGQEATEARLDAELRRVLGETRFAELKDANDPLLRETRSFIASIQLPPAAAEQLVNIQREYSVKLGAVDRDRDLTPNQRDARASALGTEARERLIQILGPANFELYKRRGGGWLGAALNRAPPTPGP